MLDRVEPIASASETFKFGLGARLREPVENLPDLIRRERVDVLNCLERHGVIVFQEVLPFSGFPGQGRSANRNKSTLLPFHVDGAGRGRSPWLVSSFTLHPDASAKDPTAFVDTEEFLNKLAWQPRFSNSSLEERLMTLFLDADRGSVAGYAEAYLACRSGFDHDWSAFPNSAVLFFADSPLAARVGHARLNPSAQGSSRLNIDMLKEGYFAERS